MGCIQSDLQTSSLMDIAFALARGPYTTDECLIQLEKYSFGKPGPRLDEDDVIRAAGIEEFNCSRSTPSSTSRPQPRYSIEHAAVSKAGADRARRRKTNQDCFLVATRLGIDKDISIYGVFDGHGPNGHLVSRFVRDNLPSSLLQQPLLMEDPPAAIGKAIAWLCFELNQREDIDCSLSGTTAVFLIHFPEVLFCVNIGDSRAVLVTRSSPSARPCKSPYQFVSLSHDHKLETIEERQRVLDAGGVVQTLPGGAGPLRVWLPSGKLPGLAMSRSIGDKIAHLVGVSTQPDIVKHVVSARDDFIVLATDGIWEFLSSEDTVNFISTRCKKWQNLDRTAEWLTDMALLQWCSHQDCVDDITAIILRIRHHKAEAA